MRYLEDEQLALMLQNDEFLAVLMSDNDFLQALERGKPLMFQTYFMF